MYKTNKDYCGFNDDLMSLVYDECELDSVIDADYARWESVQSKTAVAVIEAFFTKR
jgi:fibrillarin-like rRNA methylase